MSTSTSDPSTARQSPAPQPETPPAGSPALAFNRRVHIVAEVLDRPEELDLLQELCEAMGWPMREPLPGETTVSADADWTLRVIEVRIRGVRETAVEQGVATLDTLAQNAELSVNCLDATLVERTHRPQIEWHLRGRRKPIGQWIQHAAHMAARTGEHDRHAGTVRLVRISTALDEPRPRRLARTRRAARTALAHHPLALRRLDPDVHTVSQPSVSRGWYVLAFLGLIVTATAICLLGAGLWPAIGADNPRVGGPLIVLAGGYLLGGTLQAVRRSPTHRAVPWLVPLAVPLAVPFVPWLGTLVQRAYLSPFGVRPELRSDDVGAIQAGLWILCVFVATALLPVAHVGWMRFLAPSARVRGPWLSWAPAVTMGVGLGLAFILLVLQAAARSGAEHASQAAAGHDIPSYFGVDADYACVTLTSPDAPYFGTPPPRVSPVITFGASGDRIEFWNPDTGHRTEVRLEDARIRLVRHNDSPCGEGAR